MSASVSCVFRATVIRALSAALLLLVPALVLATAAAAVPVVPDAFNQFTVNASGQIVVSNVVGTNSIGADPPEFVSGRGTSVESPVERRRHKGALHRFECSDSAYRNRA